MVVTSRALTEDTQAVPAAHSVDLRKTYGAGQAAVHALAGVTLTFERRSDNQRIVPSQSKPSANPQRLSVQGWRGMHRQERTKRRRQILFGICAAHWFRKTAQRYVKELLHHLITNDAPARLDCALD